MQGIRCDFPKEPVRVPLTDPGDVDLAAEPAFVATGRAIEAAVKAPREGDR
jgi:hypothetical protein